MKKLVSYEDLVNSINLDVEKYIKEHTLKVYKNGIRVVELSDGKIEFIPTHTSITIKNLEIITYSTIKFRPKQQ